MESPHYLKQVPSVARSNKSLLEEDTKCSASHSQPTRDSEVFESFCGSVAEEAAEYSLTIPVFHTTAAAKLPHTHSRAFYSQLTQAVQSNDSETCRSLLEGENAAKVNFKDTEGNSPLHLASARGHVKVCEVLLDYGLGTQLNARNERLQTPLHLACTGGELGAAQLLIRSGALMSPADCEGDTPLHVLAALGSAEFLVWLLSKEPELTMVNKQGKVPLEVAVDPQLRSVLAEHYRKMGCSSPARPASSLDFEVISLLGKGSFGEVYLVQKLGKYFAMKVLRKDKILQHNLIKYAMTERNVLTYIKHPFIVSLNYAFQTAEKLFLILDYCPGKDLSHYLTREKTLSEERARIYLCQVLLAIEELHRRDIIFRDLKPENIVLDRDGNAMLTDFGLSKEGVLDHCAAKSFCGSLAYLAPEIIKRNGHGKAVDWYLLGVLLYEMLVGFPPYFSRNKEELFSNIQKGKLKVPKTLSEGAKDLIRELLKRDPITRLGANRDAEEVKEHHFFSGINWKRVLQREYQMTAPDISLVPSTRLEPADIYGNLRANENKVSGWTFINTTEF